jgi:hypothetical protein
MKSMKMIFAATLVFGLGLGFSQSSSAKYTLCEIDHACHNECIQSGGSVNACRIRCCL